MTKFRDAAELFARQTHTGTLQAEVLLERIGQLISAGVPAEGILRSIEQHPAARTHPGDPLAFARISAANEVDKSPHRPT